MFMKIKVVFFCAKFSCAQLSVTQIPYSLEDSLMTPKCLSSSPQESYSSLIIQYIYINLERKSYFKKITSLKYDSP